MSTTTATTIGSPLTTPSHGEDAYTVRAITEIARAYNDGVNMRTQPRVPADAPCRRPGADPDDWHDPLNKSPFNKVPDRMMDKIAEELCTGCPVLAACREWAIANPAQQGILGGLTHKKRLALLKRPATSRPVLPPQRLSREGRCHP